MHPWCCSLFFAMLSYLEPSPRSSLGRSKVYGVRSPAGFPHLSQGPHTGHGVPQQAQRTVEQANHQHVTVSWKFTEKICKAGCLPHIYNEIWQKCNLNISKKMNANTLKNYYSQDYFVAVPDRLLDIMVKGLRITPFSYYCEITEDIINNEKIYASLPSFTKADCLSLLGIKR